MTLKQIGGAPPFIFDDVANRFVGIRQPSDRNEFFNLALTQPASPQNADSIVGAALAVAASEEAARAVIGAASQPNHIINGDMEVWQRGTPFASAASATVSADRWKYLKSMGTGVVDLIRSTDVPTVAQAGRKLNYSLQIDVTTAEAAFATTETINMQYRMEGYDWRRLAQRDLVLSFWVKSTITGTYCFAIQNGVDRTYISEYTINVANTWELKTINIPASPAAGTWDYTTGVGAYLVWAFGVGDDASLIGTAGSWLSTAAIATSGQVNAVSNAANNIFLTGVKLEPGSVVTRHEPETFPEVFAKCRRYYQTASIWVPTAGGDKANWALNMRATPTIAGGGAGFASTGTSAANLIAEQTTGAAQTLTFSAEL